MTMFQMIATSK